MIDERFWILSDTDRIIKILKYVALEKQKVRNISIVLLSKINYFEHEIGRNFLLTLTLTEDFSKQKQQSYLKDYLMLKDILEHLDTDDVKKLDEWKTRILGLHGKLFKTTVEDDAEECLIRCIEERKKIARKNIRESNETKKGQQHDIDVLKVFSSKMDFNRDADTLYDFLLQHKGRVFETEIGEVFVKELRKNTLSYKNQRKKYLKYTVIAGISGCSMLVGIVGFSVMQLDRYKAGIRTEALTELKNDSKSKENVEQVINIGNEELSHEIVVEGDVERSTEDVQLLSDYQELYGNNKDLIGWLEIDNLDISLPVLQNKEDSEYYLTHDFYKKDNKNGALFLDTNTKILPQSDNIVIYGHNMTSGNMFGNLDLYKQKTYYDENKEFQFDTIYERGTYRIVAVIKTHILKKAEDGFRYYQFNDYHNESEFEEWKHFIEQNRLYDTGMEMQYGDKFVTLSTCEYSVEQGRLLIIAKKRTS